MSVDTFRLLLLNGLYENRDEFETYHLSGDEWEQLHRLKDEKYATGTGTSAAPPKFNIQRSRRFPIGEIDLRIDVEKGHGLL